MGGETFANRGGTRTRRALAEKFIVAGMSYEILVFRWLFHTQLIPCAGPIGSAINLDDSPLFTEYRGYCCHHQRVWADTRKQ